MKRDKVEHLALLFTLDDSSRSLEYPYHLCMAWNCADEKERDELWLSLTNAIKNYDLEAKCQKIYETNSIAKDVVDDFDATTKITS